MRPKARCGRASRPMEEATAERFRQGGSYFCTFYIPAAIHLGPAFCPDRETCRGGLPANRFNRPILTFAVREPPYITSGTDFANEECHLAANPVAGGFRFRTRGIFKDTPPPSGYRANESHDVRPFDEPPGTADTRHHYHLPNGWEPASSTRTPT